MAPKSLANRKWEQNMKTALIIPLLFLTCLISSAALATTFYVNGTTGDDTYNGLHPEPIIPPDGPKKTIQGGINVSSNTDTVIVADGTYTGEGNRDLDLGGKAITLRSENGAENTIIDCDGTQLDPHRGFCFRSGEDSNSIVDGFRIKNGYAWGGGGIYCNNSSSPTITNCAISGNMAYFDGGIFCENYCSPTITNCTISGNLAGRYGGGISCWSNSNPIITNCTISGNFAFGDGGGIYCYDNSPTITNCMIYDNGSPCNGGGICCSKSSVTMTNCTISDNAAYDFGGFGGGIYCCDYSNPTMTDCILWGNVAATKGHEIALISTGNPSTLRVRYSDVQGGAGEAYVDPGCTLDLDGTNIDADPLFVSGILADYLLSQIASGQTVDSPCVDAGSDTAANLGLDNLTTRTDGGDDAGIVDMGYHATYRVAIYSITYVQGNISITWIAKPGSAFAVQHSTDMENWTHIPVGQTDTWTDVGVSETTKFYRVFEESAGGTVDRNFSSCEGFRVNVLAWNSPFAWTIPIQYEYPVN